MTGRRWRGLGDDRPTTRETRLAPRMVRRLHLSPDPRRHLRTVFFVADCEASLEFYGKFGFREEDDTKRTGTPPPSS